MASDHHREVGLLVCQIADGFDDFLARVQIGWAFVQGQHDNLLEAFILAIREAENLDGFIPAQDVAGKAFAHPLTKQMLIAQN